MGRPRPHKEETRNEATPPFCSRHATHRLYLVEARCTGSEPVSFQGTLFGESWKQVQSRGAPISPLYTADAEHHLWPYETAQAIAWGLLAHLHSQLAYGLSVRLVEVHCQYDYEARRGDALPDLEWLPTERR